MSLGDLVQVELYAPDAALLLYAHRPCVGLLGGRTAPAEPRPDGGAALAVVDVEPDLAAAMVSRCAACNESGAIVMCGTCLRVSASRTLHPKPFDVVLEQSS